MSLLDSESGSSHGKMRAEPGVYGLPLIFVREEDGGGRRGAFSSLRSDEGLWGPSGKGAGLPTLRHRPPRPLRRSLATEHREEFEERAGALVSNRQTAVAISMKRERGVISSRPSEL